MSRKLLVVLYMLLFVAFTSGATNVLFPLTDARLSTGAATNRTVTVQLLSAPTVTSASVVIGAQLRFVTDTNGQFTFTNAMNGLYACSVLAPPQRTDFKILVTATNLGTINAAECLVADAAATFPAGSVAWSAAVTDNRYSRTTNNLALYATKVDVTNNIVTFSNLLGSAAFSNAALFYPATNPSNFVTATVTNGLVTTTTLAEQGVALTNYTDSSITNLGANLTNTVALQGTTVTNFALLVGLSATNYTALQGVSITNFILSTSNALAASFGNSSMYQPASVALTNWSEHATNDYTSTNVFITFTNLLGSAAFTLASDYQPTNTVLTSLALMGTNFWYPRFNPSNFVTDDIYSDGTNILFNLIQSGGGNYQPSNSVLTSFAALGTNAFYPTANPSNFLTSASITNIYVLNNNGRGTNTYLTNSSIDKAFFLKGFTALPAFSTIEATPNNFPQYTFPFGVNWIPATNSIFLGMESDCFAPMISFYNLGTCNATNAVLAAEMNEIGASLNFDFLYGQKAFNATNRAYEWRKMSPAQFIDVNGIATDAEVTAATNSVITNLQGQLTGYYPIANPSNFVRQTIWYTNNPSNIVVTLPSMAFNTNGDVWACPSGSNWVKFLSH